MDTEKQYETILFDLDGTLTDSAECIINSVRYALRKFGLEEPERETLYRFIGPPLHESMEKYCGFSEEQAKLAVAYYREYYQKQGIFENQVYEGVEDVLNQLKQAGKTLLVATAKPEIYADQILAHFGLSDYFSHIAGANLDGSRTKKEEVILYALGKAHAADRSKVIMVGDREHDVFGAKKAGIACIGVLYGYGSREELKRAGAEYLAELPEDIAGLVVSKGI